MNFINDKNIIEILQKLDFVLYDYVSFFNKKHYYLNYPKKGISIFLSHEIKIYYNINEYERTFIL